jgi:hypothetical protein
MYRSFTSTGDATRPRRLVLHGRGCDCPGCRAAPPWWRHLAARFARQRPERAPEPPFVCELAGATPRRGERAAPASAQPEKHAA